MNNHKPPTHLGFCLLLCCTTKAILSHSSMCICDRESRSLKPSSSVILHWERENKVFEKRSTRLLDRFSKFVITTHLPLHRSRTEPHHINRKLYQFMHGLQKSTTIKEDTYVLNSRIMSYILNILIYVDMILLDSLLQCFLFVTVVDLSSTFDSTVVSIYNLLFMFIIYFWIKIQLKVLIFPTNVSICMSLSTRRSPSSQYRECVEQQHATSTNGHSSHATT
jgi:hypothetical protein